MRSDSCNHKSMAHSADTLVCTLMLLAELKLLLMAIRYFVLSIGCSGPLGTAEDTKR